MGKQTDLAARLYSGKTAIGSVETAEGFIPHLRVITPFGVVEAPVMVAANDERPGAPSPVRNPEDQLMYALPGGGVIAA